MQIFDPKEKNSSTGGPRKSFGQLNTNGFMGSRSLTEEYTKALKNLDETYAT